MKYEGNWWYFLETSIPIKWVLFALWGSHAAISLALRLGSEGVLKRIFQLLEKVIDEDCDGVGRRFWKRKRYGRQKRRQSFRSWWRRCSAAWPTRTASWRRPMISLLARRIATATSRRPCTNVGAPGVPQHPGPDQRESPQALAPPHLQQTT